MNTTKPRFSLFDELDRGLNHLVNEVLQQDSAKCSVPALTVNETELGYVVECDLPGVTLDDIVLQINEGVLEISGKRKNPYGDDAKLTFNERRFGAFSRKLQLSKDIDSEKVDAELGNGVLKVTIPKSERVLPRSIAVRKADSAS